MVQNNINFNFNFKFKNRYSDCQTKSRHLDWNPRALLDPFPERSGSSGRANEVHKTLKPPGHSLIRAWKHRFDVGSSAEKQFLLGLSGYWPSALEPKLRPNEGVI
jgi:hypothetical protein